MAHIRYRLCIGVDVTRISRFQGRLPRVFTKAELLYCRKYFDSASHFAGTFAAKEAVSKAMGPVGFPVRVLEIRRQKSGKPYAVKGGRRLPVALSISHDGDVAVAVALRY